MSLRSDTIRLAHAKPHLRPVLLPLIVKVSMEFDTEEELKSYLESHPDADKKLHSVKKDKGDKAKSEEGKDDKKQGIFDRIKSLFGGKGGLSESDPILDDLADASPEAISHLADSKVRNESLQEASKNLKAERDTVIPQVAAAAKKSGADLASAEATLKKIRDGGQPTREEAENLSNAAAAVMKSAVDVAVSPDGGDASKPKGGGFSFPVRFVPGLLAKLWDFFVDELSKVQGLGGIGDVIGTKQTTLFWDKQGPDSSKPPKPKTKPKTKPKAKPAKPAKSEKFKDTAPDDTAPDDIDLSEFEDDDVELLKDFRAKSKKQKVKKTDAQLMQDFLRNATPEMKERLKGVSPADFMKILAAISDEEEGGEGTAKAAAVEPGMTFAAEMYDTIVGLLEKGLSDEAMKDIVSKSKASKKEASLRAATIRLAHENPHLRKHLLPLLTR